MKRAGLTATALALVLGSASTSVVAAPCDVFTDVQDTDNFCNSVQWLKNRAITLGCTSATTYCPTQDVTRASMALFMNRLGVAITPKFVAFQGTTPAVNLPQTQPAQFQPLCPTAVVPAVNYPQTVRARGSIAIPINGALLDMFLVVTLNGQPYLNLNSTFLRVTSPNGQQNLTWLSNTMAIAPGQSVAFAIGVSNPVGSGQNLNLSAGSCAIEADVINANPTSPPFDE